MRVPSCGLAIISSLGFSFANGPPDVVLDGHNIPAQAMRATVEMFMMSHKLVYNA